MAMPLEIDPRDPEAMLQEHVRRLLGCTACPAMKKPVVSGGAVVSRVMLVGQAPGDKEPVLGKPFAWTAGKTLFRWFEQACGMSEAEFRASVYMAAVCRCFPGKKAVGGDRVPSEEEIQNCSTWLQAELQILEPALVIPVGRLAISQFLAFDRMESVIGKQFRVRTACNTFDLVPLPHPSGASTWHRREPGKTLLERGLNIAVRHPAFLSCRRPGLILSPGNA